MNPRPIRYKSKEKAPQALQLSDDNECLLEVIRMWMACGEEKLKGEALSTKAYMLRSFLQDFVSDTQQFNAKETYVVLGNNELLILEEKEFKNLYEYADEPEGS